MPSLSLILCPVDSSDFSRWALGHAALLARSFGARLTALSVRPAAPPPELWLTRSTLVAEETPAERAAVVDRLRQFVTADTGEVVVDVQLRDGEVVSEILRAAGDGGADLIVMGTHGLSGFRRLLLGSVTERVLQQAPCPVLAVRGPAPAGAPFQSVVCGMDTSPSSARALALASQVTRRFEGRLTIVHAIEDFAQESPEFRRHFNIEACWRAAAPEIRRHYEGLAPRDLMTAGRVAVDVPLGKAWQAVLEAADTQSADLIVVGAAGANTPFGTTALRVVREAGVAVLVVTAAPPPG